MRKFQIPLLLLLSSCAGSSHWQLDEISAGNQTFDSSRIRYSHPENSSPLAFELIRVGDRIEAFLNLNRYTLTPSEPNSNLVNAIFDLGEERVEEAIPLLEGRMRIRLSQDTSERIILALQDGKKVSILVDSFEETLEPNDFSRTYERFLGNRLFGKSFLENLLKGPLR